MLNKTQEFVAQAELFLATVKDFFSSHCTYTPFLYMVVGLLLLHDCWVENTLQTNKVMAIDRKKKKITLWR